MSDPRKSHKSDNNRAQRVSTTCLHTPPKSNLQEQQQELMHLQKQCPYHFSQPSHVCLTCRRSICLRCAITYCQQHTIHPQQEIMPLLLIDLQKLTIQPRIDDIQLKLKQSEQRQQYLSRKIKNMVDQVEENFQHLKIMLDRKKQQILQYFQQQLGQKYLGQYHKYDSELYDKRKWLQSVIETAPQCKSIEEIDQLAQIIKKRVSAEASKHQIKATKLVLGKDKIKTHKVWSEQKLERILYEIENISYKLKESSSISLNSTAKKKRVTTESSQLNKKISPFSINSQSPFANIMKSNSNSRFPTGRKNQP